MQLPFLYLGPNMGWLLPPHTPGLPSSNGILNNSLHAKKGTNRATGPNSRSRIQLAFIHKVRSDFVCFRQNGWADAPPTSGSGLCFLSTVICGLGATDQVSAWACHDYPAFYSVPQRLLPDPAALTTLASLSTLPGGMKDPRSSGDDNSLVMSFRFTFSE